MYKLHLCRGGEKVDREEKLQWHINTRAQRIDAEHLNS